jgi:para-nitrobenzyl esterase
MVLYRLFCAAKQNKRRWDDFMSTAKAAFIALLRSWVMAGLGSLLCGPAQASAIAQTESGLVRGVESEGLVVWRGIPYAAPPIGELRWRVPQPAANWDGESDASQNGHACPQALGIYPPWADAAISAAGIDEDCLTLNVWAPADAEQPLPVMFYIHGGNMQYGSNAMPIYNGEKLSRMGVVLVVINYRLGYLGRFGHPSLRNEQPFEPLVNYGIFDQIAALKWVRQNIAAFGGDPDNITIFGHSAGGVSVNVLMTTPQSKGLFHKAIAQGSGVLLDRNQHAFNSLPRGLTGLSSMEIGAELAENFAIDPADYESDAEVVAALRAIPWQELVTYSRKTQRPFNPVVDMQVVTDHVAQIFERGEQHDVPYIGGANSWEWNQIDGIPLIAKWFLGGALIEGLNDEDLAIFSDKRTRIGLSQRWFAEGLFLTSTRYFADQMKNVISPAWHYHVTFVQEAIRGEVPGAAHGVEMPAIFGGLAEHPEYQRPQLAAGFAPTEGDLAWADTVRAYWVNFAKTGDPNGAGLPEWPRYDSQTDLTMDLGNTIQARQYLNKETLDYLEERALIRRQGFDRDFPE